jgi:hypothetical protein
MQKNWDKINQRSVIGQEHTEIKVRLGVIGKLREIGYCSLRTGVMIGRDGCIHVTIIDQGMCSYSS